VADSDSLLWTQLSWINQAHSWIDRELHQLNIQRLGAIKQPHIRPWSTVFRIPTNIGNIYFKAVVSGLAYESTLTQSLAQRYSHCLPAVLSIDAEQGWLLMADGGIRLRENLKNESDIQHWLNLLPIYVKLQQDAAQHLQEFLELGVPDRRLATLPTNFQQLLANTEILAIDQPGGLSLIEYQCLQDSNDAVAQLCSELAKFGIPETINHGDLHDGNVFIGDESYLFFDWGDSSISHPFFSLHSPCKSLERTLHLDKDSFWWQRLDDCYLDSWAAYETRTRLQKVLSIAQQLSPILAAGRWLPVLSSMDKIDRHKYIAAVPDLLREFLSAI
jgi:hypothetical protein